jgi:hypothetical protein
MRIINQFNSEREEERKRIVVFLFDEEKYVNSSLLDFGYFRNVDLRELLPEYCVEPSALIESPSTTYDLISNVVHDGEPGRIKLN